MTGADPTGPGAAPGTPGPGRAPSPAPGRVRPLSVGLLCSVGVVGLVLGWLVRPIWESTGDVVPLIGWRQPLILTFMALLVGWTAWVTWRTVRDSEQPLPAQQGLNRLVLAKTCAVLGALAAGAYGGHLLSWIGIASGFDSPRIIRPLISAAAALLVMAAGIALEHACRVRSDSDDPGTPGPPTSPTAAA